MADRSAIDLLDGRVADLGGLERVDVGRLGRRRGSDDLLGDRLELRVLRDEVGLGVQLDQRTVLGGDQALGGRSLGALADVLGALDAQQLDGLVEVAVGLNQRVLESSMPAPVSSRSRLTSAAV